MNYTYLVESLREPCPHENCILSQEAAYAIEKLQAAKCPHYIRNVHDRGDDSLCRKYGCEVNALPRWIPVTERLPGEPGAVLCYCIGGKYKQLSWMDIYYWTGEKFGHPNVGENDEVTHWMPLPEPPKEET